MKKRAETQLFDKVEGSCMASVLMQTLSTQPNAEKWSKHQLSHTLMGGFSSSSQMTA